ncbi:MAG: hypothetical protein EAZ89_04250 [Bacteroidetes bacterium]|nr:MAG: hypothetical protein EAZ89_04250 [Bacteroidota bacterium]
MLLTIPVTNPSLDFRDKGQIGDTIGGLMNPFIALAGVSVTFLAFYMQLQANKIQLEIFNENQKEQIRLLKDQKFQKLLDVINQRIISFTYTSTDTNDNSQYYSYQALDKIVDFFHQTMNTLHKETLRTLILYKPSIIEERTLFDAYFNEVMVNYDQIRHLKTMINELKRLNSYELRYDYLCHQTTEEMLKKPIDNPLYMTLAAKYFYHEELINKRKHHYAEAYHKAYLKFGGFLDGYFKNFSYLIHSFANETDHIEYLRNNLSTQELTLIFYHIAAGKSDFTFNEVLRNSHLLEVLAQSTSLFAGSPKTDELTKEIHLILSSSTQS